MTRNITGQVRALLSGFTLQSVAANKGNVPHSVSAVQREGGQGPEQCTLSVCGDNRAFRAEVEQGYRDGETEEILSFGNSSWCQRSQVWIWETEQRQ